MTSLNSEILGYVTQGGLFILALAMVIALYRVVRGPSHADRIIALDLLSILVVAMAALYAVHSGQEAFLDVAIAYALIAFLGTVAFARYLERLPSADDVGAPAIEKGGERDD